MPVCCLAVRRATYGPYRPPLHVTQDIRPTLGDRSEQHSIGLVSQGVNAGKRCNNNPHIFLASFRVSSLRCIRQRSVRTHCTYNSSALRFRVVLHTAMIRHSLNAVHTAASDQRSISPSKIICIKVWALKTGVTQ